MGKVEDKLDNFKKAVKRLNEANTAYKSDTQNCIYRDSLIKRYEFTFELAWKTLKEFIDYEGYALSIASPKNVIAFAYREGFLDDEKLWLDMLESRNLVTHDYDDELSDRIAQKISDRFCKQLQALCKFIAENVS